MTGFKSNVNKKKDLNFLYVPYKTLWNHVMSKA